MVGRVIGAVTALVGAGAVSLGSFITLYRYTGEAGFSIRIIERHPEPNSLLFLALEPLGAVVITLVAAALLLALGRREAGAVLVVVGVWMLLLFGSYAGWIAFDGQADSELGPGAIVGCLGGAAILAGGLVSWFAAKPVHSEPVGTDRSGVPPQENVPRSPAGWYPDPADSTGARYWDGTRWTDATRAEV
jgi:hypothetical protein